MVVRMQCDRQQHGFSLIELMFIIAFMAIIFMYSISMVRGQARQEAITNTAIGIKSWLQATLAYYSDNNSWPSSFDSDVVGSYLPTALACTQFGGSNGGKCTNGNTSYLGTNNQKYYTVSTDVSDEATAKAIAAKVPSGEYNGVTVKGSVPIPGAQQGYITSAGVTTIKKDDNSTSSRTIHIPPCEPGFEAHYMITPLYYTTGFGQGGDNDEKEYSVINGINSLKGGSSSRWYTYANTTFNSSDSSTHYYGYFLTFCTPEDGGWDQGPCGNALPSYADSCDPPCQTDCQSR